MRVIIAGSRELSGAKVTRAIERAVARLSKPPTEIVHGGCRGVDTVAANWAMSKGIKQTPCPADWDRHGLAAGPIRNSAMAIVSDACILIWDGIHYGPGTSDMRSKAEREDLEIVVEVAE